MTLNTFLTRKQETSALTGEIIMAGESFRSFIFLGMGT